MAPKSAPIASQAANQTVPTLTLKLFGTPEILVGETPVTLETAKARALFYYLAVTGQPHSRGPLVELLWGEMGEAQARRNLTATLTTLRKHLAPYLVVETERVAFAVTAPHTCDATDFRHLVERGLAGDQGALVAAVARYRGEFLAGLAVKDAVGFEDWLFAEREQLRELMLLALEQLVEAALTTPDYAAGVAYAQQLLALDPWRESAHRQLMMLHAQAGRRDAALTQYEVCRRILEEELGVEPAAETEALVARLQRADAPPPHNLPAAPNAFVGRSAELAEVATRLAATDCRLVTLVGPGGVGKTRLALEAARRYVTDAQPLVPDFSDGVLLVELAGIAPSDNTRMHTPNANALITAIAEAMHLTFQGKSDLSGQLLAALKAQACLLLLDNFEHLLTGTRHDANLDFLAALLRHAPHVKLLVTSRERLNLQEEWVVTLEGLDFPAAPAPTLTLEEAQEYGAVALFVQRGQQANPRFVPTAADAPHFIELCTLLEGLPLGIELAANWVRDLSCAEIVQEIKAGLDFLATPLHNLPPRHQSLRAVFDHAWQRLSEEEQRVLCGLALFRGSFGREAAGQIVGARLLILQRLADKSLVRRVEATRTSGGAASDTYQREARYDMHALLRQYLMEQWVTLAPPGEAEAGIDAARAAYCDYYLRWMHAREAALYGTPDAATLQPIWHELDNVRQAWQWAVMRQDHALLAASLGAVSRFFIVAGLFQEAGELFETAALQLDADEQDHARAELAVRLWIEQAQHLCRRGQAKAALVRLPATTAQAERLASRALAARAHLQWAEAASGVNDHGVLREHAHTAVALAREVRRVEVEAEALRYCGIGAERAGKLDEAAAYYEQALTGFRQVGDTRGVSLALNNLGLVAHFQHRFAEAETLFADAMQGFVQIGDRWGQNVVLNNRGNLAFVTHDYDAARQHYQAGLGLARALHDLWGESHLLHNLGTIACFLGRFDEAEPLLQEGLRIRQEIGAQLYEGFSVQMLGVLHRYRGQYPEAVRRLAACITIAQAQAAPWLEATALTHTGFSQLQLEDVEAAVEAFTRVVALAEEAGDPDMGWEAMAGLAEVRLMQGDKAAARQLVETLLPELESDAMAAEIAPFQIHLSCYRVLAALGDERSHAVVALATLQLKARAARIQAEDWRRSYLEAVPAHRALLLLTDERVSA